MMDASNTLPPRLRKWLAGALFLVALPFIGALQPVWGPWAEMTSHSLSARVTSSVPLRTAQTAAITDMVVSVGGRTLASPYLSTVVLTNDGAKPVLASDFESALEFTTPQDVEIVRGTVSAINPPDLRGIVTTDKQSLKLQPMLLNPGDSLQFSVLTTGKPPVFTPRARIAGISQLSFKLDDKKKIKTQTGLLNLFLWIASMIMYPLSGLCALKPAAIPSIRGLAIGGVLISVPLVVISATQSLEWLGFDSDGVTFSTIVSVLIFFYLMYRSPNEVWGR